VQIIILSTGPSTRHKAFSEEMWVVICRGGESVALFSFCKWTDITGDLETFLILY